MRIGSCLTFLVFLVSSLFSEKVTRAQSLEDTLKLREVEVLASYPVTNMGFKKVRMDSTLLMPNISSDLSTVLTQYSTVFIKSYGNGNLATPSFRGTSAQHTQVEWNGIDLNSPMLGQMDLSQLPVSQFGSLEILYGAAGMSNASGAFGGVINLVSSPDWSNRWNIGLAQTFGSFNTFTTNLNAAAGNSRLQSITIANFTTSANDFPFSNDTGATIHQINGSYYNYGISEDLFLKIGSNQVFTAKVWYSKNFRNIPPIIPNYDAPQEEEQEDEALRALVEWKLAEPKYNVMVRSAFIDQFMHYRNETVDSRHRYYSWPTRLRFAWTGITNLNVKGGLDFTYDWVFSDAYETEKFRNQAGLFSEATWQPGKKTNLSAVIREDMIDGALMPLIFAAGVVYRPFSKSDLGLSANGSRNYRYPTLNDLYWYSEGQLFGNPNLKPEQSYGIEGGIVYNFLSDNKKVFVEGELTGYYSWISNMIQWQPTGNSINWKPINIKEVYARGIEVSADFTSWIGAVKIDLTTNYTFCRSTSENTASPADSTLGKQLIYMPLNAFNGTLKTTWKTFYLLYNFTFTGKRYTSPDNESYMPGYNLSNIFLGKNFKMKDFVISLQIEMNNVFDLDYQSIANRPMPGRNYALTLKGSFSK